MDKFFTKDNCDRCGRSLKYGRTMSWFTEQTICMECSQKESELRKALNNNGIDYEGCGWIPKHPLHSKEVK
jgi:predicted nucleic acid-binding Zn ribbon protein